MNRRSNAAGLFATGSRDGNAAGRQMNSRWAEIGAWAAVLVAFAMALPGWAPAAASQADDAALRCPALDPRGRMAPGVLFPVAG